MTAAATIDGALPAGPRRWLAVWACALSLTLALYLASDLIPWLNLYPDDWMVPFRAWAGTIVKFQISDR